MHDTNCQTVQLGALIAAAFDQAALHSEDPRQISRLATLAVKRALRRARRRPCQNSAAPPIRERPARHRGTPGEKT